jgi:hypothetical protein
MEVARAIDYFSKLSMSWFFAACSLITFRWYVLLIMQEGKTHQITKMEQTTQLSCQVKTEACLDSKEPNPEDMESEVERSLWKRP